MKKMLLLVSVSLPILSLFTTETRGIPNEFNTTAFITPAGMRLEDYAAQKEIWIPRARLIGEWEMWRDDSVADSTIEVLRLNMPAIVFGVPAAEVTVQRRDDQILQFQVAFQPYERIDDFEKLTQIVRRNASLWAGEKGDSETLKQGSALYFLSENREEETVIVKITPQS